MLPSLSFGNRDSPVLPIRFHSKCIYMSANIYSLVLFCDMVLCPKYIICITCMSIIYNSVLLADKDEKFDMKKYKLA